MGCVAGRELPDKVGKCRVYPCGTKGEGREARHISIPSCLAMTLITLKERINERGGGKRGDGRKVRKISSPMPSYSFQMRPPALQLPSQLCLIIICLVQSCKEDAE